MTRPLNYGKVQDRNQNARTIDFMESFGDLTQECSNDDLGLTTVGFTLIFFYYGKSNVLSVFYMGRDHGFCTRFSCKIF